MSLINQMLNDLDSRNAFVNESASSILDGVSSSDLVEPEQRSHPLLFSILIVCALVGMVFLLSANPGEAHLDSISRYFSGAGDTQSVTQVKTKEQPDEQVGFKSKISELDSGSGQTTVTGLARAESLKIANNNAIDSVSTVSEDGKTYEIFTLDPSLDELKAETYSVQSGNAGKLSLQDIRVTGSGSRTAISLLFNHDPEYSLYTLSSPSRLVLDFGEINLVDDSLLSRAYQGIADIRQVDKDNHSQLIFEFDSDYSLLDTSFNEAGGLFNLAINLQAQVSDQDSLPGLAVLDPAIVNPERVTRDLDTTREPEVVYDKPTLEKKVIQVDRVKQSQDLYEAGLDAIDRNELLSAIDKLYMAVDRYAENHAARLTLITLLLEQGDKQAAGDLLADGLKLKPDHSAMASLQARLLVEQKNNRLALYYLLRAQPDIKADPDYFAFIAAILQREQRHSEAIQYYRKVLSINQGNGFWWMGLGISLEAIGARNDALLAYLQAKKDEAITANVAQYLENRIQILDKQQAS